MEKRMNGLIDEGRKCKLLHSTFEGVFRCDREIIMPSD